MSVTLTTEQFSALINNVNIAPKKKTKSLVKEYVNAANIEEFVENMEFLKVSKLLNIEIIDFIVETIKMNIDHLEETEYPFVCANYQKRFFYYKTKGEWKKGSEFIKLLYNTIVRQAYRQIDVKYSDKVIYKADNDNDTDEIIEKRYDTSKHSEKQQIFLNLCHVDKYSFEKVYEKVLTKLGKMLKADLDV